MGVEMVLLTALVSTLSTTSVLGKVGFKKCHFYEDGRFPLSYIWCEYVNVSQVGFTIWIWAIYATFPGTYSTQPAVTTQTFGHK